MKVRHLFHDSLYRFDEAQPSYWEETAGDRTLAADSLAGEERCDVAIIGGGHNGLATATVLAKNGQSVLVLEKNNYIGGMGASSFRDAAAKLRRDPQASGF